MSDSRQIGLIKCCYIHAIECIDSKEHRYVKKIFSLIKCKKGRLQNSIYSMILFNLKMYICIEWGLDKYVFQMWF